MLNIKGCSMTKVLISEGYGAGWSSWEDVDPTDEGLIRLVEDNASEATLLAYAEGKWPDAYKGGLTQGLKVVELPEGVMYQVREYDGAESIEVFNPRFWRMS